MDTYNHSPWRAHDYMYSSNNLPRCVMPFSTCCHLHCLRCLQNAWATSWSNEKMKSWTVTRVIMWLLCDHGVEASKDWFFVAHFIHLFNTMMPMPCTDVHSGAPMSQFLHRRVGMGCQALNFLSRGNYVFKMWRMHACLQNMQPLYNTFNAPALWKTSQVWVSSAARQERPSMFFNFKK